MGNTVEMACTSVTILPAGFPKGFGCQDAAHFSDPNFASDILISMPFLVKFVTE